jgi:hypothetical protein
VKLRLAAVCVVALVLPVTAGAAAPFRATLTVTTHTPRVNAVWPYTVRAADLAGRPIRATVTTQIVDPFGGVHPVEFDCCKKKYVTNHPFTGVFRDRIRFPPETQGIKLTVRFTVKARGGSHRLTYWVKPR